jgi:ketosteroid isomerase-like protein
LRNARERSQNAAARGHQTERERRSAVAHPNEARFREGYELFGKGALDTLRKEYFTDDIVWHSSGNNALSGDARGMEYTHVVHFRDGKVAESWIMTDEPEKPDAVFA